MQKCSICSFSCAKNMLKHMEEHGFSSLESAYIATILQSEMPTCKCGCGKNVKFVSWNKGFQEYATGHNAKFEALSKEQAEKIRKKRSESLKKTLAEKGSWSKGLTKENSEIIKRRSERIKDTVKKQFESGRIPALKGLTKETNESILAYSIKQKEKFASGECVPWSKGKSKLDDHRVLKMSETMKRVMNESNMKERLNITKRLSEDEIKKRIQENAPNLTLLTDLSSYVRDKENNLLFSCIRCGKQQKKSLLQAMSNSCDFCNPAGSAEQNELFNFVTSLGVHAISCDRSVINPYELDVSIPDKKFAIEFNGLYFHSEQWKARSYHSDKTTMCANAGWQLLHVFDDEWKQKKEIVKSMICHKLGITNNRVFARNCKVIKLSSRQRETFFNSSHIDGDAKASICFALVDKQTQEILCAISLRKPSHKKYNEQNFIEIARFATKLNTAVVGGFTKLLFACKEYSKENGFSGIMSYVDLRHGIGSSYEKAGFTLASQTANRFWWTDGKIKIDRFSVRADKKNGLSERDVANQFGVVKIWGCPNLVFTIQLQQ